MSLLQIRPYFEPTDRRGDYVPPPLDQTRVKLRVLRACLVQLQPGQDAAPVEADTTLTLPRWQAQQIVDAGRGEIL